jgi:GNAT superfamily N-acetyltransferase
MQVRAGTENDIARIVELLRLSLGESSSEKSVHYWKWKHEQNPFGPSPVLLAEEDGELIGVRAMMQWQWQQAGASYRALRAVDTATHPAHQGKGIFSKLTKQMVDDGRAKGFHFIFNTPNEQSRPGYLKMGWKDAGKLNVGLKILLPIPKRSLPQASALGSEELDGLCDAWNSRINRKEGYFTPKSASYLNWRYSDNPLIDYCVYQDKDIYLAMHIRKRKAFNELRVSELIYSESAKVGKRISEVIRYWATTHNALVVSYSPVVSEKMGGIAMNFSIGPILTIRNLNMPEQWEEKTNWNYCIGDLELF